MESQAGTYKTFSTSIPSTKDWRSEGAVTPIQDQASCGACWTFMSTGAVEGHYKIAGGGLFNLSEQQILDCDNLVGASGCSGGTVSTGFDYLMKNKAVNGTDYSYTGVQGSCSASQYTATDVGVKTWNWITSNDSEQLKAAVATGPVGVAINGGCNSFMFYKSGTFTGNFCGNTSADLNHAVLLVGYGTDSNNTPYFILKNQWSTSWGDQGYMNIAIESGNGVNGINIQPVIPTSSNGASSLWYVCKLAAVTLAIIFTF